MKRFCSILLFIIGTCLMAMSQQLPVFVKQGTACELPNPSGIDHVFIFQDLTNAEIDASSEAKWYTMENGSTTFLQDGVDYLYPENNTGYKVEVGSQTITFWVLDYSQYRLKFNTLSVDESSETRCQETPLILDADIPEMSYQTQYGQKKTITRNCEIEYTSLSWDGEAWSDSICKESYPLHKTVIAGAPLKDTHFTLRADEFLTAMNLPQDSISTDLYKAVALSAHPTSITTIRGNEQENLKTNEIDRPTDDDFLKGSAPLDILFKANANVPVAEFYQWKIFKGSDLIVQRTDAEHRYTFDDFGEYRVLLWVNNSVCTTDSFEIDVSVSASQLIVPNVFTPNGDGANDEFRVCYRSIVEFDCWIYNRWGHLVYHWSDPAKGWDGTINGRPAAEGAYFYVIRAKGADAESGSDYMSHLKHNKAKKKGDLPVGIYQLGGDINLIRGEK